MDEMERLFRQSDFSSENEGLEKSVWNWLTNYKEGFIMPINKKELTKEMLAKAMQCKDANELIALAKTGGYELTKEEAESYMAELSDFELDHTALRNIAGGKCYIDCFGDDCSGRDF